MIHWEFIDDVGALVVSEGQPIEGDTGEEFAVAREVGASLRAGLAEVGLGFHKEEFGGQVKSLGHEIAPETFGVRAARAKLWPLMDLTDEMALKGHCSAEAIEIVVSTWCWLQMCQRSALSIWDTVYGFVEAHRGQGMKPLPMSVRQELQAAVHTAIFLDAPMKLPWASKVLMTDSGPEGGAVISTEATVPEVRAEAGYAESRGWSVALHRIPTRDGVYYLEAKHGEEDRLPRQRDAALPRRRR